MQSTSAATSGAGRGPAPAASSSRCAAHRSPARDNASCPLLTVDIPCEGLACALCRSVPCRVHSQSGLQPMRLFRRVVCSDPQRVPRFHGHHNVSRYGDVFDMLQWDDLIRQSDRSRFQLEQDVQSLLSGFKLQSDYLKEILPSNVIANTDNRNRSLFYRDIDECCRAFMILHYSTGDESVHLDDPFEKIRRPSSTRERTTPVHRKPRPEHPSSVAHPVSQGQVQRHASCTGNLPGRGVQAPGQTMERGSRETSTTDSVRSPLPSCDNSPGGLIGCLGCPAIPGGNKLESTSHQVDALQKRLADKDRVIAAVTEEFVRVKKELGEP